MSTVSTLWRRRVREVSLRLSLALLLVAGIGMAVAAPAHGWRFVVPSGVNTFYLDIATDPSGAVVVSGRTGPQTQVRKIDDSNGELLWNRALTGTVGASGTGGVAVTVGPAGHVVVAGGVRNAATDLDLLVAKLEGATGNVLWRFEVDGPDPSFDSDTARDVVVDAAGDVVVTGILENVGADEDLVVIKIDGTSGAELWRLLVDGDTNDAGHAIEVDAAGDVLVAGSVDADFTVLKIDGTLGTEVWRETVGGGSGQRVLVTASGDVVATGTLGGAAAVKLDGTTGAELWRRDLAGGGAASSADLDAAGDIVMGGSVVANAPERDMLVWKVDGTTGADVWLRTLRVRQGPVKSSAADGVVVDAVGDVYVAGFGGSQFGSHAILKFDGATGDEIWRRVTDDGIAGAGIALDTQGDVVSPEYRGATVVELTALEGIVGPIAGKVLVVKDQAGKPEKRTIVANLKDPVVATSLPGGPDDPTLSGGAVRISNPITAESATFVLPAAGWTGRGNPPGSKGYRYRGGVGEACKTIKAVPGKLLKVTCAGNRGPIPFTLDEPSQGELQISLQLGAGRPQCATFGGDIKIDVGTSLAPAGRFTAKDAGFASGDCPIP